MTPKEFRFLIESIELTAAKFYERGREDQKGGKSLTDKDFKVGRGAQLLIQKNLNQFVKNR